MNDELKRLAEEATPGPWSIDKRIGWDLVWTSENVLVAQIKTGYSLDARYIAAANPKAILALIAERDELLEKYQDLLYQVQVKHPGESRHDTAKRRIAERGQQGVDASQAAPPEAT